MYSVRRIASFSLHMAACGRRSEPEPLQSLQSPQPQQVQWFTANIQHNATHHTIATQHHKKHNQCKEIQCDTTSKRAQCNQRHYYPALFYEEPLTLFGKGMTDVSPQLKHSVYFHFYNSNSRALKCGAL